MSAVARLNEPAMAVSGYVTAWLRSPGGAWVQSGPPVHNIATNWALQTLASWYLGVSNVPGSPNAILAPTYVALGIGSGTASTTDLFGWAEQYGTRTPISYTALYQGTTAQATASYQSTQANGTWSEAMFFDSDVGAASVGAAGVLAGATSLPLASGAPAVTGGSIAGQYETIYLNDATHPEYCSIATTAAAGAPSWTLQAGLKYAHAASTPIIVFGGNLWAHSSISVAKAAGQQLSVQWSVPFAAQA